MSRSFVLATDAGAGEGAGATQAPVGRRNYLTPAGYARLREELRRLVEEERPQLVQTVAWAASNGDRSENGDYLYGKRRLREIDRRVRYLVRRLEIAEVIDASGRDTDRVYFGATVRLRTAGGERTVAIVGEDEVDPARGRVSWASPVARAILGRSEGDTVAVQAPAGVEEVEILEVRYDPLD